ncbi:MAG: ketoacyl-ACP synthase III [Desulfotalea sp.]
MSVVILGTGSSLPKKIVTNRDLEKTVDTNDEWIITRTGIAERRIAGKGENTHILASNAARQALDASGLKADDIDIIILGTISAQMAIPACACLVQDEIGAKGAFAFDVGAACSGFLYVLDIAEKYLLADHDLKILCIGVETLSTVVDWEDRNTCILFGDGAGAAVLGYEEGDRGIVGSELYSDGSLKDLLYLYSAESKNLDLRPELAEDTVVRMEGREIFKYAVKCMESAVNTALENAGLSIADVDVLVPHQANIRIVSNLGDRLGLDAEKVFVNLDKYGNTSAASVPIALDEAVRSNMIKDGDLVALCAFGGGLTWGACLVRW